MAEILLDRSPDTSFGAVAQKVVGPSSISERFADTEKQLGESREKTAKNLEEQSAAVKPKLEQAMEMGERLVREAEERRKSMEVNAGRVQATAAQQPSLGLRPFLSPINGEPPETAIAKLIQAVGLFGAAIAGNARGDARGGLAALTGAMAGWHEGDRERADRAFGDWDAKMGSALAASEQERRSYRDWFMNANLTLEQMFKGAEMTATIFGNERAAEQFRQQNLEKTQANLFQWQQHEESVRRDKDHLKQAKELSDRDFNERRREFNVKQAQAAEDRKQLMESYSPEVIQGMGIQWATKGVMPAGLGRSGPQAAIRGKIVQAGLDWAKSQGIDPGQLPGLQAEIKAGAMAIGESRKKRAVANAAVGTFERHMAQLVELSGKVDRDNRPVIARYQMQIKGEYQGDPETAAFKAMAMEAAQEFAKVSVGTAQGDAGTREEARKTINTALNHQQLTRVADELKRAAESRLKQWDEVIAGEVNMMNTLAGAGKKPEPAKPTAPAAAGGWQIVK